MKISIKAFLSDIVLFEGSYESTKEALVDAVNKKADLRGADLRGADLRGADLYGANGELLEKIYVQPIQINGLHNEWQIIIFGSYLRIGCEEHKIAEWESFKDSRIEKMSSQAVEWWAENKSIILTLAKAYLEKHLIETAKNKEENTDV